MKSTTRGTQQESAESSIQAILAPYHRQKFRLDCGHQVTLGYFLGAKGGKPPPCPSKCMQDLLPVARFASLDFFGCQDGILDGAAIPARQNYGRGAATRAQRVGTRIIEKNG